ncbi:MAG TPA: flagellar hook-length control protein FliK [Sulfuriferula sp.]|nr:flagellar hook-length control protein FliK [Sulfuriferula sp.]
MNMTPTNAVQAQTSPAPIDKQANAAPAEVPFNQVLSGEITSRQNSANADKAQNKNADSGNGQDQQTAPSTTNSSTKEAKPAEAADAQPKDSKDGKNTTDSNAVPSASAELLALVANLNQTATKLAEPVTSAPALDTAATTGVGKAGLSAHAGVQKSQTAVQLDGASEKTPPIKPDTAFTSLIKQAGESKPALDQAAIDHAAIKLDAAKIHDIPLDTAPAVLAQAPLQQASLAIAQAAVGHPAETLTPKVGTAAWDQALGQKIVWMVAGAQQSASLTLNPPDLGPLQVVLHVSNDQANATFIAAQPEVRQALEAALPRLREMMGDAGIQLGQSTVSAGTPNQHDASGGSSRHASPGFHGADGAIDSDIRVGRSQIGMTAGQGMVDTFA